MPPTYSPLWKPFEILARLGLSRGGVPTGGAILGFPESLDALGGLDWRALAATEALFAAWAPPDASPWSAYMRPTLFAALDGMPAEHRGPRGSPGFEVATAPRQKPAWVDGRTAILLELPGPMSVAYGAWLARVARMQPVATFNNWPHAREVGDATATLAALLHYATWMREARERWEGPAAPVFLLDDLRLGARTPKPGDFDNRYYLLDSDLPTPAILARQGIERVVYVHPPRRPDAPPDAHDEMDDMNPYLRQLAKRLRLEQVEARLDGWGLAEPRALEVKPRDTPFNTVSDPAFHGFRRNAAGGFGVIVPEPSQGGYVGGFG